MTVFDQLFLMKELLHQTLLAFNSYNHHLNHPYTEKPVTIMRLKSHEREK